MCAQQEHAQPASPSTPPSPGSLAADGRSTTALRTAAGTAAHERHSALASPVRGLSGPADSLPIGLRKNRGAPCRLRGALTSIGFGRAPKMSIAAFKQINEDFQDSWASLHPGLALADALPGDIEREYWRIVEGGHEAVSVLYASDLQLPQRTLATTKDGIRHPWDMNRINTVDHQAGLFKHLHIAVPGIATSWVYIGMLFSTFCWHTEVRGPLAQCERQGARCGRRDA